MRGGIYSTQKCPDCGRTFKYLHKKGIVCCEFHADRSSEKGIYVKFGRKVRKRFNNIDKAERFLTGLRYEVDRGTFDERDYQTGNPLGFITLSEKWLTIKEQEVKPRSFSNLERYMRNAAHEWGDRNIKEIGFSEIEDFLLSQKVSNKTKSNIKSCFNSFWEWLVHRRIIIRSQFPEMPAVKYKLGYRKIVDKDTQNKIVDEVYKLTYHKNPRIWLGIKWLCTYIAIRPGELLKVQEQDVNTRIGAFVLKHTKEGHEKVVPMLENDKLLINELPVGMPDLPFFRHGKGISGCKSGQPFGEKYLYKWWKKACSNLGVEGVDLYGGTRHSSATALKDVCSPEQIKAGTMHSTNKAFERYFQRNSQDAIDIYTLTETKHDKTKNKTTQKIVSYRK